MFKYASFYKFAMQGAVDDAKMWSVSYLPIPPCPSGHSTRVAHRVAPLGAGDGRGPTGARAAFVTPAAAVCVLARSDKAESAWFNPPILKLQPENRVNLGKNATFWQSGRIRAGSCGIVQPPDSATSVGFRCPSYGSVATSRPWR